MSDSDSDSQFRLDAAALHFALSPVLKRRLRVCSAGKRRADAQVFETHELARAHLRERFPYAKATAIEVAIRSVESEWECLGCSTFNAGCSVFCSRCQVEREVS